jgi:CubicO group peptidase (beta-lactamase class C family)
VDSVFAAYNPNTPGCAVGVSAKGEAPVLRAYGSADLEHRVANAPETIFEAGSVSKQFTAAAVLLLVQDGKLQLSDDIRKYLPEMPDYGTPITIQHLLSHTSGLRDWGDVQRLAGWPRTSRAYTNEEALQIAARQKALNYPVGSAYSYTNTGYNLSAVIVQRVSGQSLAEFSRERIFKPLGMAHTSWRDDFRRVVPGRAIAYGPGAGGWAQNMPFENVYGNGGLLTTVGDLLTWNDALTSGKLGPFVTGKLQEQSALTDGRKIAYARGLFVQAYNGRREISHSGSTAGYRAWLARYPDDGLSVAVLCNAGSAPSVTLGRKVVDLYLAPPTPRPAAPFAPEDLARAGLYVDERTGSIARIVAEGGMLRIAGGPRFTPLGDGRYAAGDSEVVFAEVALERRTSEGGSATYRRVQPWKPAPADLAAVAGTYASDEANARLIVTAAGGVLRVIPADRPSAPSIAVPLYRDTFDAGGALIHIVRGKAGKPTGLRFTEERVYDLVFTRVAP